MTYDPIPYWRTRGANYEARFQPARYAAQEAMIVAALQPLEFETVLEVGCGFGRIGALIKSIRPGVEYTGIDISPDLINSARTHVPDGQFYSVTLGDFDSHETYDLVIAVEVLMHIPPGDVERAVARLFELSKRHVVTVDWTQPVPRPAAHNFVHDYTSLLPGAAVADVGLQTIHVVEKP